MTRLLVSVRNAVEAREAMAGGADLIDMKEPRRGPLGPVDAPTQRSILEVVSGRRPVSMALGELGNATGHFRELGSRTVSFVKVGLAGWINRDWRSALLDLHHEIRTRSGMALVPVAYADHQFAEAPDAEAVLDFTLENGFGAWMIDTFVKDGTGLRVWCPPQRLERWATNCHLARLDWALAGSLQLDDVEFLRGLKPTWVAVRGAVCDQGRDGVLSRHRVATWVNRLTHASRTEALALDHSEER